MLTAAAAAGALTLAAPARWPSTTPPGQARRERQAGRRPARTLRVCKRRLPLPHDPEGAVDAARPGDTVKVAHGTYHEGVSVRGRASATSSSSATERPQDVVLEGTGLKGAAAQNGIIVNSADEVTIRGLTTTHYKGNGFFVVNATATRSPTCARCRPGSTACTPSTPRAARCATPRPRGTATAAVHRTDAAADQAQALARDRHQVLRQRARLLRHEHALRDDHEVRSSSTTAPGSSRTRSTPRSSRRRRTTSSPTTTSSGTTSTTTRAAVQDPRRDVGAVSGRRGVLLFGGRHHGSSTTASTATTWSASARSSSSCRPSPTQRDPNNQRGVLRDNEVVGNDFGLGGADLNGRDMFYDGSGSGNCFADNTLLSVQPAGERLDLRHLPVHGRERVRLSRPGRGRSAGWRRRPLWTSLSLSGGRAPTRPRRASSRSRSAPRTRAAGRRWCRPRRARPGPSW